MTALLLTAIFLLALTWPRLGLLVLAASLPSYLVKFNIGGIPSTLLELSTYAVAAAVFLRLFFDADFRTQALTKLKWLLSNKSLLVVFGLFLAAAILATVVTWDSRTSLGVLKGWYFDPLVFGLLVFLTSRSKFDLYNMITALSAMAAALSTQGILEYFSFVDIYTTIGSRVDSIFTSPNYHALLAGPVIVLALGLLMFGREIWKRPIYLALLIGSTLLNLTAFYLTYSYGGYVGLTLALAFLVLMGAMSPMSGRQRTVFRVLAVLGLLATVAVFFVSINSPKFQRDFDNRDGISSFRGRYEVWSVAREIITRHPLTGVGLGNYDKGYLKYIGEAIDHPPLEPKMIHAHNIFLDFWTDGGLAGLLTFVVLLGWFFRLSWRLRRQHPELSWSAAAAMVAVIGHGLLDTPYFKNDLSYLFWFIVFVQVYLSYRKEDEKSLS